MRLATLKFSTTLLLIATGLLFFVWSPSRTNMLQLAQDAIAQHHSDTGGQTASPNPSNRGADQEERVRQMLAHEYNQSYTTEKAINDLLGFKGKTADFLGYNSEARQWLIAESKGTNLNHAFDQLENTLLKLLDKYPNASVELRIYVNERTFKLLQSADGMAGWTIDGVGYLRAYNEAVGSVTDVLINGIKIITLQAL